MTTGTIGILNVGAGDTKLSFDSSKPKEVKRAAKVVKDMLERGYAIMVEVGKDDKGPLYRRAEEFDPATNEYIIMGAPEEDDEEEPKTAPSAKAPKARKGTTSRRRIPASKTHAVAVARSAGG